MNPWDRVDAHDLKIANEAVHGAVASGAVYLSPKERSEYDRRYNAGEQPIDIIADFNSRAEQRK